MGIYGAMMTAVTGLSAQSYALENISGNIANSQTVGYKRVDTAFEDMIGDAPLDRQNAGSVAAYSQATNTIAGAMNDSAVSTHIAINGDGFFVVRDRTDYTAGQPVFGGQDLYTRRGDFELDSNGYLVNKAGNYLMGLSVDPTTGNVNGATNSPIQISRAQIPAARTTTVQYQANLPRIPTTPSGNEVINPAGFAALGTGVTGTEESNFLSQSIQGPTVTVYDSMGTPVSLQTRWAKTNSTTTGGTDTWQLFYLSNPTATGGTQKWTNTGTSFTFDTTGKLTSSPTATIPNTTIGGTSVGPITFDVSKGLTQYSDVTGQVKESYLQQNGYTAGVMSDVRISQDGTVSVAYTNGQVLPVAEIAVAQFNAPNMLKRMDGGTFSQTLESGTPLNGLGGSKILSGKLEGSNSDIADEFSKMIVTQQAYSANTRVITTSQQMLQDVLNIIR
jgi:flagellar hook protein FlgE